MLKVLRAGNSDYVNLTKLKTRKHSWDYFFLYLFICHEWSCRNGIRAGTLFAKRKGERLYGESQSYPQANVWSTNWRDFRLSMVRSLFCNDVLSELRFIELFCAAMSPLASS